MPGYSRTPAPNYEAAIALIVQQLNESVERVNMTARHLLEVTEKGRINDD